MPFPFATDKHPWLFDKYLFEGVKNTLEHYESETGHKAFDLFALNIEQIFSWYVEDQLGYRFTTKETKEMPVENGRHCYGFTDYTNKIVTIAHDKHEQTQRHTMAHELFHVLHHRNFVKALGSNISERKLEDQAHAYARCVLMPEDKFRSRFDCWKSNHAAVAPSQDDLTFITQGIAGDFNVSCKNALRRMLALNLYCPDKLSAYLNSNDWIFPLSYNDRLSISIVASYSQKSE
jgi:Zn-dependent peptidase ImmA (M78 family)